MENRVASVSLRREAIVVKGTFLRIDEDMVRLRKKRKLPSSSWRTPVKIGVEGSGKLSVSRPDLGYRGRSLYTQHFIVIDHGYSSPVVLKTVIRSSRLVGPIIDYQKFPWLDFRLVE